MVGLAGIIIVFTIQVQSEANQEAGSEEICGKNSFG